MPLLKIDTSKNITGFDHQNTGTSRCNVIMIIFLVIILTFVCMYCEYNDFIKMKNKMNFIFNNIDSKRKIPTLK